MLIDSGFVVLELLADTEHLLVESRCSMHQHDCSAYVSELGDGPAKPHRIFEERALLA